LEILFKHPYTALQQHNFPPAAMYFNTLPLISEEDDVAAPTCGTPAATTYAKRPAVQAAPANRTVLQKLFAAWIKPYEMMSEITTVM
jgi:hypothetical protein